MLDWPEPVKLMQRNWIGRSTGAHVEFPFARRAGAITVFTTRPDTLFGATYMVMAPEHPDVDALTPPPGRKAPAVWTGGHATPAEAVADYRVPPAPRPRWAARRAEKTGVFTGAYAINPVNGASIPVFIADYVLAGYGTGAIMAVPGQDERDWEFAEVFELPIIRTVRPPDDFDGKAYIGEGPAINSPRPTAAWCWTAWASPRRRRRSSRGWRREGAGAARSRTGCATGCSAGSATGASRSRSSTTRRAAGRAARHDAAGRLPEVDDFSPRTFDADDAKSNPETPLSRAPSGSRSSWTWATGRSGTSGTPTRCPTGRGRAGTRCATWTRTTRSSRSTRRTSATGWAPRPDGDPGGVDLYIGGMEHAVLHLLYARFWHKVLFDLGYVSSYEPYRRLFNQGYIQAYAYRDHRGMVVPAEEVVERDGGYYFGEARSTASTARWASP